MRTLKNNTPAFLFGLILLVPTVGCGDDVAADMDTDSGDETSGSPPTTGNPPTTGVVEPTTGTETAPDTEGEPGSTSGPSSDTESESDTEEAAAFSMTILHMNDHHSHLEADDFDLDVSGLGLNAEATAKGGAIEEVEVRFGGMPMLTALFESLEAENENVVKVHAGDAITGTLYYSLFSGAADAAMMNEICFDAFALGNHEFDDGDAGLAAFLDELAVGDCSTPVIAANVAPGKESPLAEGYLQPYVIRDLGGEQVGFVGIDIAQKTMVSSMPDEGTVLLDEAETAQSIIDELAGMEVDKVVLVTHYQYAQDLELAAALTGVDVIVGGDSHTLLGGEGLTNLGFQVGGDYPTEVTNADGEPVCVVQAWEYAHLLGELHVEFDGDGVVTSCAGTPRMPFDAESFVYEYTDQLGEESDEVLVGDDVAAVVEALTAAPELVAVTADRGASSVLDGYRGQVAKLEQTPIGSAAQTLCLERFPGQGQSGTEECTQACYAMGSEIADVVAAGFMTVTPTADFAIQNAGGVRETVDAGEYTIADAYNLLPFSNTLVTLELTGTQIRQSLEDGLSNHLDDDGSTGSYPYAAGLRFDVDASAAAGSRILNLEGNPRLGATWMPLVDDTVYIVVTNSFIAQGFDGYDTFGVVFDEGLFIDTFTEYAQGWIDFVELNSPVSASMEPNRSTQSYVGRDGCDHAAQDDCTSY
ncbi:MAG: 5'-nucleotidase C-terminal domain-containing protein [Nannocystales bacterium]